MTDDTTPTREDVGCEIAAATMFQPKQTTRRLRDSVDRLFAELDRLRADNERLTREQAGAALDNFSLAQDVERLTRERDEARERESTWRDAAEAFRVERDEARAQLAEADALVVLLAGSAGQAEAAPGTSLCRALARHRARQGGDDG